MRGLFRWLACFWALLFAPAPPSANASVVGVWEMTWCGISGSTATFSQNGTYTCSWFGTQYDGHWRMTQQGELIVSESPAGNAVWSEWTAVMEVGSTKGKMKDTGAEFKLVAIAGGKL